MPAWQLGVMTCQDDVAALCGSGESIIGSSLRRNRVGGCVRCGVFENFWNCHFSYRKITGTLGKEVEMKVS